MKKCTSTSRFVSTDRKKQHTASYSNYHPPPFFFKLRACPLKKKQWPCPEEYGKTTPRPGEEGAKKKTQEKTTRGNEEAGYVPLISYLVHSKQLPQSDSHTASNKGGDSSRKRAKVREGQVERPVERPVLLNYFFVSAAVLLAG